MISQLASPSVCVIDDEEADYRKILEALNALFVSCVHILGNDLERLPPAPFRQSADRVGHLRTARIPPVRCDRRNITPKIVIPAR